VTVVGVVLLPVLLYIEAAPVAAAAAAAGVVATACCVAQSTAMGSMHLRRPEAGVGNLKSKVNLRLASATWVLSSNSLVLAHTVKYYNQEAELSTQVAETSRNLTLLFKMHLRRPEAGVERVLGWGPVVGNATSLWPGVTGGRGGGGAGCEPGSGRVRSRVLTEVQVWGCGGRCGLRMETRLELGV
jgi:hypothetical protein